MDRYTLLAKSTLPLLRLYWQAYRPSDWLFPGQEVTRPLSERSVQKIFKKALTEAEIPKAMAESFRAGFQDIVDDLNSDSFERFTNAIDQPAMLDRIFALRLINQRIKKQFRENFESPAAAALSNNDVSITP